MGCESECCSVITHEIIEAKTIVVLRGEVDPEDLQALAESLGPDHVFIQLDDERTSIEMLDEDEMRKCGWVRA